MLQRLRRRSRRAVAARPRRLRLEALEEKRLLAVVPFGPQQVVDDLDADGADRVFNADIDGDGDQDLLVASYRDGRISWYENRPEDGFLQHRIDEGVAQVRDVLAADFDGDGDLDVAAAAYLQNSVQWYENVDGDGNFDTPQVVTDDANGVFTLDAADLDGDGDVDLVSGSWFDDKVAWYENDGTGLLGVQQVLTTAKDGPRSIRVGDINGDTRPDLLVASRLDDTVSWIPNLGSGNFGSPTDLAFTGNGPEGVELADADGDGDLDAFVITFQDNTVAWFENENSEGRFGPQQTIGDRAVNGQFIALADLDGDGDLDVVAASYDDTTPNANRVSWFPNDDSPSGFGDEQIITQDASGVESVALTDVNQDGATDVITASAIDNKVSYYRNLGNGQFDRARQVLSDAGGAASAQYADVDGDGDLDIVAASYWDNSVSWYQNLDGQGTFGPERVVSRDAQRIQSVRVADLNGDGHLDLMSASYRDGKIAWYANDGQGNFGDQQVVARLNGAIYVHAADVDNDGDLDLASASANDAIVAWYENTDGDGTFGPINILTRRAIGAEWVSSADLDGDGDLDLLNASYLDDEISWFENQDGRGDFSSAQVLATGGGPTAIEAADIDGDGDLDLVSTRYETAQLVWLENLGDATFSAPAEIANTLLRIEGLKIADIDGSGSPDILVSGEGFVIWYEYLGDGRFASRGVSSEVDRTFDVDAGDVNGDGTLDVLSVSFFDSTIAYYANQAVVGDFNGDGRINAADIDLLCAAMVEPDNADSQFDLSGDGTINADDRDQMIEQVMGTSYGDSNLDNQFDSADLVTVFAIGQYEDDVEDNSTWRDGDWNCDGDFTSRDLVLAFQRGMYVG